jgi:GNAT superfamily N-acetyltransferase
MSLADGYTPLPAGKIASVVTYLEMRQPPEPLPSIGPGPYTLQREARISLDRYRALFRRVGQEWLWFSRLRMSDEELAAIVHHAEVDVFVLRLDGRDEGLLELDRRSFPEIELAFFGVTPGLVGQGAGRYMMAVAQQEAWRHQPERFTVHTCTLDHPRAVAFYCRSGFAVVGRAVEVSDDPRLTGEADREAAAWFPVVKR